MRQTNFVHANIKQMPCRVKPVEIKKKQSVRTAADSYNLVMQS